jgi:hypothetical protein
MCLTTSLPISYVSSTPCGVTRSDS